MARSQARRRKAERRRKFRWPVKPLRQISVLTVATAVVLLCYRVTAGMLDQPIESLTIEGPFQRVSALQIEEAISAQLGDGFVSANLAVIRERIVSLPWIDDASVARRWPGTLEISVTEQIPAAVWGGHGLLNTRGDLFVRDARHLPAELPRLEGPDEQSAAVATRYLELREQLIAFGLDIRGVSLDARGAWTLTLANGVEVRLGRRDVDQRSALFVDVVAGFVASRESEIEFVDMRYSNGFSVGWKDISRAPATKPVPRADGMVAGLRD